jgi:hypothetical protein
MRDGGFGWEVDKVFVGLVFAYPWMAFSVRFTALSYQNNQVVDG